ncbi:MAG: DUF2264 domain-containing protein, partial [Planctomycetes bacterium]|nr:DUF2264 domain-containing protein [Planctomycetota bacterium]
MPSADLNVPENRDLSPLTGWTRDHWLAAVERMVAGVMPYVDRRTGLPHLVGDPDETALAAQLVNPGGVIEALERTMMLVAAHVAATGRTTVPGYEGDIAEPYRKGMLHFIDPGSPEYRRVSFGSGIVLASLVAPEAFIDPLTDAERDLLREHLSRFIQRPTYNTTNTLLFAMMPTALVLRLGGSYDRDQMADRMDAILSMYRGDGWFIDGWNQGFDHYNFWGFQLYLHALVHFDPWLRDRYAARVREITLAHEETLPYLFGRDGGPIPKGRSLNYRFASISGIAFSQLSGLSGMHPGLARRISSGCLKFFWDHGCLSERGLLEPGYWGPNSAIGEDYTDRGAPYWASTGLMSLALPADHEFWTAVEQPLAADGPDVRRKLVRGGRMILKADGPRGEARMITVGEPFRHRKVWQAGTKYFQHAYSSSLGYALAGDLGPELAAGRTGMSRDGKAWA